MLRKVFVLILVFLFIFTIFLGVFVRPKPVEAIAPILALTYPVKLAIATLLSAAGITFVATTDIEQTVSDFWDTLPETAMNYMLGVAHTGQIIYDPLVFLIANQFRQNVETGVIQEGGFPIGELVPGTWDFIRSATLSNDGNFFASLTVMPTERNNSLLMIDYRFYGDDINAIELAYGDAFSSRAFLEDILMPSLGLYYRVAPAPSPLVLITNISGPPILEQNFRILVAHGTDPMNLADDAWLEYGGIVYNVFNFPTWELRASAASRTAGDGRFARIDMRVYRLTGGAVSVTDAATWDIGQELTAEDVQFHPTVLTDNPDLILEIPQLDSLADVVNLQSGQLDQLTVTTTGIAGILGAVRGLIATMSATLSTVAAALTTGLVGNVANVQYPQIDLSLLTTRFPFSLPFDFENALDSFNFAGTLPTFHAKLPMPLMPEGGLQISFTPPEEFNFMIDLIRGVLLFMFTLSLIYLTPRLLGGAK